MVVATEVMERLRASADLSIKALTKRVDDIRQREGIDPKEACALLIDELIADGQAEAFVRLHGTQMLYHVWMTTEHLSRPSIRKMDTLTYERPRDGTQAKDDTADEPAPGVVDIDKLRTQKALLETAYRVPGIGWVRLGDFGKQECVLMQQFYAERSASFAKNAKFFERLAADLTGDELIAHKWDEPKLMALFGMC
jgi:hypothetical protein